MQSVNRVVPFWHFVWFLSTNIFTMKGRSTKPQLVSSNERFCRFLEEYCPVVTETYYPTIWCWEGRVQTLLRPFITSRPQVQYRK
ncbi:hypothetical protein CIB84_012540 [Bambusicola thoracicus]|uniref:Uncharacterized protein n=1 Tax=Bambusicola thoracicus TaxID=9083 RepID=A0A2P4SHX3_BAMTH|nr:hypothetical protein CIB84_012540 [Bambusicola thoracicus]